MSQKAFVLFSIGAQTNVEELNKLLDAGWVIDKVHPMTPQSAGGTSSSNGGFAALVVLAKS